MNGQCEISLLSDLNYFSDTSVESLKYLTSKQALADLDTFIRAMMTQYESNKVIVFGGSYAGNLAAWYRSVYNTAIGSIASSAPVTAEVDFTRKWKLLLKLITVDIKFVLYIFLEYLDTVGYAMDYFVPNCSATVQQGFASLQSLVQSQDTATIRQLFP